MANLKVTPAQEKEVKSFGFVRNRGTDNFSARVITVNGKISAAQQVKLGEAADKFGRGDVTFTSRLTVEIPGIPYDDIQAFRDFIAEEGLETGGTGSKVRPVMACKGTVCVHGLCDTFDLSEKFHDIFYVGHKSVMLPHKFKIAVGGCPNSCMKPTTNDIAIVGQLKPNYDKELCMGCKTCPPEEVCPIGVIKVVDGVMEIGEDCNNCGKCIGTCNFDAIPDGVPGYEVSIGGQWGKWKQEAKAIDHYYESEEEVIEAVEKLILLYREKGQTGERVAHFVNRYGHDNLSKEMLSDDVYDRKEEILGAELHITGGATC